MAEDPRIPVFCNALMRFAQAMERLPKSIKRSDFKIVLSDEAFFELDASLRRELGANFPTIFDPWILADDNMMVAGVEFVREKK